MGASRDHFDDVRRQPDDVLHHGAQFVVELLEQVSGLRRGRRPAGQQARHHRIALLGAGHGLHHVAREGRMQIAEETDAAAVLANRHEHGDLRRLRHALGLHRLAVFADRLEPLAVQENVVLDLRGRARCWAAFPRPPESTSPASRHRRLAATAALEVQRRGVAVLIQLRPLAASAIPRSGCLPRAPWRLLRGSACSWAHRSAGGGRRW